MYSFVSMDNQNNDDTQPTISPEVTTSDADVETTDDTVQTVDDTVTGETTANDEADETDSTDTETKADGSGSMLNLESIIKRHLLDIQKLQNEYKENRSMFEDSFNNDANYRTLLDKAKEATRLKNAAKQQLLKSPGVQGLADKIKSMKEELSDLQSSLSDYLQEYQRVSGSNQFQTDDGEVLEIVQVTKVVRKSKYRA